MCHVKSDFTKDKPFSTGALSAWKEIALSSYTVKRNSIVDVLLITIHVNPFFPCFPLCSPDPCHSPGSAQGRLDGALNSLLWWKVSMAGDWNEMVLEVPSSPKHSLTEQAVSMENSPWSCQMSFCSWYYHTPVILWSACIFLDSCGKVHTWGTRRAGFELFYWGQ